LEFHFKLLSGIVCDAASGIMSGSVKKSIFTREKLLSSHNGAHSLFFQVFVLP